jgi:hypothetical protein
MQFAGRNGETRENKSEQSKKSQGCGDDVQND